MSYWIWGFIIVIFFICDWSVVYKEWWIPARKWILVGIPISILCGLGTYLFFLGIGVGGEFCEYWANPDSKVEKIFGWIFCR